MTRAYSSGTGSIPLSGQTISENLRSTVARYPNQEAIVSIHQNRRLTYAEFDSEVDEVARAILSLGLRRGDRMGMWSPNTIEWALIQYATARIGVILVNINPAYRTSELAYALEQSGCSAIVTMDSFRTSNYREMVEAVMPSLPMLEHVIYTEP